MSRGDTAKKDILESERVCDRHFISGRLQLHGTSTISIEFQLYISVKRNIRETNRKKKEQKALEERAERAKERRKLGIERQELEVAKKRKHLNASGDRVVDIHFTETITSNSTEDVEAVTGHANPKTEMEPSEPPCSTICATSGAENQAKGSLPEPSKDAKTQTEENPAEGSLQELSKDAKTQTEEFAYVLQANLSSSGQRVFQIG